MTTDAVSTVERTNVWRRTLADGRETRLTNLSDQAIARFALSPDGQTLLLSRNITTRDAFLISNFRRSIEGPPPRNRATSA